MNSFLQILLICLICALVIVGYGSIRCNKTDYHDPLTNSLAPPPFDRFLDGWGITHFAFYGILAYFYPQPSNLAFIWCIGVVWEVIESIFHEHPFYLSSCKYKLMTDKETGWWYGRWQDIVMNSLGMVLGYTLSKYVK